MTHCGVLEFTAEEGLCFLPFWMMQNLLLEEGSLITVTNVSLPKATFVKLKPQHIDFLEISNPRAVLEHALRNFSCVTRGDIICVPYNNKNYHFELMEVKPQDAACIIETDCNVDFDAPVGYVEPPKPVANTYKKSESQVQVNGVSSTFSSVNGTSSSASSSSVEEVRTGLVTPPIDTTNIEPHKPSTGVRIVNGKIIRPENYSDGGDNINAMELGGGYVDESSTTMLADKVGGTGVQRNAAISVKAPQVEYWAVHAGDGARLDGKAPTPLKDKEGNQIDIRKLRAEAAAKRITEEEQKKAALKVVNMPSTGLSIEGKEIVTLDDDGDGTVQSGGDGSSTQASSKRKSRVGSKYSKLKGAGGFVFHGSGNSFDHSNK